MQTPQTGFYDTSKTTINVVIFQDISSVGPPSSVNVDQPYRVPVMTGRQRPTGVQLPPAAGSGARRPTHQQQPPQGVRNPRDFPAHKQDVNTRVHRVSSGLRQQGKSCMDALMKS